MCRKNQLLAGLLIAFGLGMLLGRCLESGFMNTFFAILVMGSGIVVLRQK